MAEQGVPRYRELPLVADSGEHSSWGVFGPTDELGTVNFLTAEAIAAAAATVTAGEVVTMGLSLDQPAPPLAGERAPFCHEITRTRSGGDDRLDGFFPQGSTQWDGLAHVRFREHGYYNGLSDADLDDGRLGIDAIARHGIIGRGILVDVAEWSRRVAGHDLDPQRRHLVTPAELDAVLAWQRAEVRPGDVLVLRTGWLEWYAELDDSHRASLAGSLHNGEGGLECPGLSPGPATAEWLWDHRIAAMAADTPTVEALPVRRDQGFLHRRTLALLGMPIGEFWWLAEVAQAARRHRRHCFLLSASPWLLPRGVGSPVNPQAVF